MKTKLLSIALLLIANIVLAQLTPTEISRQVSTDYQPAQNNSYKATLWDQSEVGNRVVASFFASDIEIGVYPADDFELTTNSTVTKITSFGFQTDADLATGDNYQGFSLFIYENDPNQNIPNGIPNDDAALFEINLTSNDPALTLGQSIDNSSIFRVEFDITAANGGAELTLSAGKYWIIIVANQINLENADDPAKWEWFSELSERNLTEPHFIDPADVFNGGLTSWTGFTEVGLSDVDYPNLAYIIEGDEILSTQDFALSTSIFPNPTSTILNIKTSNNISLLNVTTYDMLGKKLQVPFSNEEIDLSQLNSGMYNIKVDTDLGSFFRKVIKK